MRHVWPTMASMSGPKPTVEWQEVAFFAVFGGTPLVMAFGPEPLDTVAAVFGFPLALFLGSLPYLVAGALVAVPLAGWLSIAEWLAPDGVRLPMQLAGLLAFAFVIFGGLEWLVERLFGHRSPPP